VKGICGKLDGSMKTDLAKGDAQYSTGREPNTWLQLMHKILKIGRVP
jgi:hypothetical protein